MSVSRPLRLPLALAALTAAFATWLWSPRAFALAQFDLVDVTYTANAANTSDSHYFVKPSAKTPANWRAPIDFASGKAYVTLDVIEKPSAKKTLYNICFEGTGGAACLGYSPPYTAVGRNDFNQGLVGIYNYNVLDWTKPIARVALILKDENGNKVQGSPDFYPTKIRVRITMVPPGETYVARTDTPDAGSEAGSSDAGNVDDAAAPGAPAGTDDESGTGANGGTAAGADPGAGDGGTPNRWTPRSDDSGGCTTSGRGTSSAGFWIVALAVAGVVGRRRLRARAAVVAAVVSAGLAAACAEEDASQLARGPGGGSGTNDGTATTPEDHRTGGQLRRLTHAEYANTVRDLVGVAPDVTRSFPEDQHIGIFENHVRAGTVSGALGESYLDAAETIATAALAKFEPVVGCAEKPADETKCARDFVRRFGRRAFRRPLTVTEAAALDGVYDGLRKGGADFATATKGVLEAMLVSPSFLYRIEFGAPQAGAEVPFTAHEMASRLSYALWGSMPDDTLFAAADSDTLHTREQVLTQARRMIADPKAKPAVASFYAQWLELKNVATVSKAASYGTFDDTTKKTLVDETQKFVDAVVWGGDAKLATLLTAPWSFVNATNAPMYGVKATGSELVKTQLDPAQRAGILTQPSILAQLAKSDESSPIRRGAFVRNRIFCQNFVTPNDAVPPLPPIADGLTTRERIAAHTKNAACAGCHKPIDGVGFGLENYDAIGRWRSMDEGKPVDAAGEIIGTTDANGTFTGGVELAKKLAASQQVRDCVATLWFRYVNGREEADSDAADLGALHTAFASTGGELRELLVQITQLPSFDTYRRPAE